LVENRKKPKTKKQMQKQPTIVLPDKQFSLEDMERAIEMAYSKGLSKPISGRLSDVPMIQKSIIHSLFTQQLPKEPTDQQRWHSTEAFVAACTAASKITEATGGMSCTIDEINAFQELLKKQGFSILPIKQ